MLYKNVMVILTYLKFLTWISNIVKINTYNHIDRMLFWGPQFFKTLKQ